MASNTYFTYNGPANTNQLLATTTSSWLQQEMADNIFNMTPVLKKLYANKKTQDGGASILIPVLYEVNSTGTWYDNYETLNTTPQDGMTLGQAKWKNFATTVSISGPEERQNSGKNQMINLLDAKYKQAEMSVKKDITSALFASSVATNAMNTMVTMIDATSTIHDINSTTYSWWQASTATGGSFASQGLSKMRTAYTTIAKLTPETLVDTIITTDTVYNYYEGSLTAQQRYTSRDVGDATFQTLRFQGADVMYDNSCTSGVMYMYPSKNLFLVVNSSADLKRTQFIEPFNQDAKVAKILLQLQLVTNARRKLYKLTAITA